MRKLHLTIYLYLWPISFKMDESSRKKILSEISPSKQEDKNMKKCVDEFISLLVNSSKKLGLVCDFYIGGSFGKGTYLKGKSDVDIFCRFSLDYEDNRLSSNLLSVLEQAGIEYVRQKGSRDYFSGEFARGKSCFKFELIPCFKIENLSDAKNTTDYSPLHVEFLRKKIEKNSFLIDEIRLAKQFFKSKRLYGAESYINGFSGHVIDILITYYKSLKNLLINAKTWEEGTFIDICNYYKSETDALESLSKDKISNLVIVDPILKDRNAAKALSTENYSKFVFIANLIDELVEDDFMIEKKSLKEKIREYRKFAKKGGYEFVAYEIDISLDGMSEDIVGSKLLKIHGKVFSYYSSFEFEVFEDSFEIDFDEGKCVFIYLLNSASIPKIKKICGPSVFMKDASKKFIEKRRDYFVENSRVCAYEKRRITSFDQIKNLGKKDFELFSNKNIDFIKKIKLI